MNPEIPPTCLDRAIETRAYRSKYFAFLLCAVCSALSAGCQNSGTTPVPASQPGAVPHSDEPQTKPEFVLPVFAPEPEHGFSKTWNRIEFNHSLWNQTLQSFVDRRGRVNYAGVKGYRAFREYVYRLSASNAEELATDSERLAFWINAYNALTVRAVLATLPEDEESWKNYRIDQVRVNGETIWKGLHFKVGGGEHTLDQIEHEILRKRDGLRDPRMHVALVCAARGCPSLFNLAYTGPEIDRQLTNSMKRFLTDRNQFEMDPADGVIHISKIFDWYGDDFTNPSFTPHARSIPYFLADFCDIREMADRLRSNKIEMEWKLQFKEYDWRLNIQE